MWKDVTKLAEIATEDLNIGQLLSSNRFSLYDAINAIEIMDPRMDTGLFRETAHFDVYKRLSLEDTLDVMDSLVVREMSWISGHSISQTVFTCVYFHHMVELNQLSSDIIDSKKTEDVIYSALRIYLLATLKCCHYVWSEMSQRNLYDGEDFTTHLFGLSFNHQLPDMRVLNDLDSSILHLKEIDASPVLCRVAMRRSYLLALMYMSRNKASHLLQSKNEWVHALQMASQLSFSDHTTKDAFDSNISRKLSAYTPPRPASLDTKAKAYQKYRQMIYRLISLCDILNYTSVVSLLVCV
ncbi:Mak10 subunit, NatC N-terminal acetyltransferase-domain-containing protein [Sporodiniella umbellata]|nr:Mak10 subunit, NatC N-terminal acetyltransferase-domain-containing protein [Sporodiniella umbellata]